jgi:hypothetical protein
VVTRSEPKMILLAVKLFNPEDSGSMNVRNVSIRLQNYRASQLRRQQCEESSEIVVYHLTTDTRRVYCGKFILLVIQWSWQRERYCSLAGLFHHCQVDVLASRQTK